MTNKSRKKLKYLKNEKGLSLKQINLIFLEGESPTLSWALRWLKLVNTINCRKLRSYLTKLYLDSTKYFKEKIEGVTSNVQ